jgi:preprotein translocase subunit SecE
MNRQAKRMLARQKTTTGPQDRVEAARQRRAVTMERKKRSSAKQFLKEVRLELKKVNWPTRQELLAYTMVVLVAVVVLTSLVFGMDLTFSKAVLHFFSPNG